VLLEDSDVHAAAIIVRHDNTANARIDAYVVPAGLDTIGVRKRAASVLPEYMVPATVTALSALPLTTNGKLDTAELPLPAVSTVSTQPGLPSVLAQAGLPSGTDGLAGALQETWGEVFGVAVGLDDDFYHLGGNSLLAVRIAAAMRARGLPSVGLRDLFRNPTIRALISTLTPTKTAPLVSGCSGSNRTNHSRDSLATATRRGRVL